MSKETKRMDVLESALLEIKDGMAEFASFLGNEAKDTLARLAAVEMFNRLQVQLNETQNELNLRAEDDFEQFDQAVDDMEHSFGLLHAACVANHGTQEDKLREVCDYLNVERLPIWHWDGTDFQTVYMLRVRPLQPRQAIFVAGGKK